MNFGNGGGSFTGNFLNLQRASTTKFSINATGTVVIASSTAAAGAGSTLTVCAQTNCTLSSTSSQSVAFFASIDGTTSTNSIVARGTIAANSADFGEYVPVLGDKVDYEAGDLLSITSTTDLFAKSAEPYDAKLAGAVTQSAAFVGGLEGGIEDKVVMAVAGRIRIKVVGENGPIKAGDPITASSLAGYGMKATEEGRVVGIALESFEATSTDATGKILVLINPHWYVPKVTTASLQGGSAGTASALNTYTFDSSMTYSFENLKVQNLEIGSEDKPTGITTYDIATKKPYCVVVENGNMRVIPGKCYTGTEQAATTTETQITPRSSGGGTGTEIQNVSSATTSDVTTEPNVSSTDLVSDGSATTTGEIQLPAESTTTVTDATTATSTTTDSQTTTDTTITTITDTTTTTDTTPTEPTPVPAPETTTTEPQSTDQPPPAPTN